MPFAFSWLLALWLLGWLMLPLTRHVFISLPDGGLAAGRVLALALLSLAAFWGASLRLIPLSMAPLWLVGGPLLCAVLSLRRAAQRRAFLRRVSLRRGALAASDLVFVLAFAFFLWLRARHPELNDLEKPMDAALLGSLTRAQFLPPENPWLSGTPFTNYYYFGHLMAALPARVFATPTPFAYNLAQPLWCALFLSSLWSLCAALTGSLWRGLAGMSVVALLGNFEPLRQMATTHRLWPLDWWSTSRVIPDTINEYPAFTMLIGDLHAHFLALPLAVLFFCLCHALVTGAMKRSTIAADNSGVALFPHHRIVLTLTGLMLGVLIMTNTWDALTYGLLALLCALYASLRGGNAGWRGIAAASWPFLLAPVVAWPYLSRFKAPFSGVVWELWSPPLVSFGLLWGGLLALCIVSVYRLRRNGALNANTTFLLLAGFTGLGALLAPMLFYVRGVFGSGVLRHQDTVFKFGLQAWLLLGVAACGAFVVRDRHAPQRVTALLAVLLPIPLLCSAAVLWARAELGSSWAADNSTWRRLSLDGARHLPSPDRAALDWLSRNARPGDTVLEAANTRAYSEFGRVSALTGIATPLGWPQHLRGWGVGEAEIERRLALITQVYTRPDAPAARDALRQLGVRYVFAGDVERRTYGAAALSRLRTTLPIVYQNGDTFIARVP